MVSFTSIAIETTSAILNSLIKIANSSPPERKTLVFCGTV
jgi:hypothetical protein